MLDDFSDPEDTIIKMSIPEVETLSIEGVRIAPLVINISKATESDPIRDAKMLSTYLICSLPDNTLKHLIQQLVIEKFSNEFANPIVAEPKPKPRKKQSNDFED